MRLQTTVGGDAPPPAGVPEPNEPPASPVLAHVALVVVSLLFGANYVVAKVAMRELSPLDLVVIRTTGTAGILFAALRLRPTPRTAATFTRRDRAELLLYSFLGATINQLCFLGGLARTTATNAALMLVSIPLLTLAFAVMLGRERLSWHGVIGIAIGLAGALLLLIPTGGATLAPTAVTGNLLLFVGAVAYALYLVLMRGIVARHDPLRVVSWVFLFAALSVFPFGLRGVREVAGRGLSPAAWASVAYVVVGATVLPYLLNSWALVRVDSSIVAIYILVQPVVAAWLGRVFLNERFGPHTALAAVLVVGGVVVSGRRPR